MAVPREDPEPVKVPRPDRLTLIGDLTDRYADPAYRRHTLELIRQHDVKDWHTFWGSTPMAVRRELIQEAWLGAREIG